MRVQVTDYNSRDWIIDSQNPAVIGSWFTDIVGKLATNIPAMMQTTRIRVVPDTHDEAMMLRELSMQDIRMDSSGLVKLYLAIKQQAEACLREEMNGNGETA